MTQLSFLDTPRARNSDPMPSHVAAEQVAPKLGRLQAAMLEVLSEGRRTAMEAAVECVSRYGGNTESYRKRVHELVRLRKLKVCEPRPCQITK